MIENYEYVSLEIIMEILEGLPAQSWKSLDSFKLGLRLERENRVEGGRAGLVGERIGRKERERRERGRREESKKGEGKEEK